jgi:hypothetical protein
VDTESAAQMRLLMLGVLLLLFTSVAWAHPGDSDLSQWYRSLRSNSGMSCCDISDCQPARARMTTDGWQIKVGDEWREVPAEAVLQRDNLAGEPVACLYLGRILCFVPGSEG